MTISGVESRSNVSSTVSLPTRFMWVNFVAGMLAVAFATVSVVLLVDRSIDALAGLSILLLVPWVPVALWLTVALALSTIGRRTATVVATVSAVGNVAMVAYAGGLAYILSSNHTAGPVPAVLMYAATLLHLTPLFWTVSVGLVKRWSTSLAAATD